MIDEVIGLSDQQVLMAIAAVLIVVGPSWAVAFDVALISLVFGPRHAIALAALRLLRDAIVSVIRRDRR